MTLEERWNLGSWVVSAKLFGNTGADINDFLIDNYVYFLDHVETPEDLVGGLEQLSPLADDALVVAEKMSRGDFETFKHAILTERPMGLWHQQEPEKYQEYIDMPERFLPLLIPDRFVGAQMIADIFEIPLGTALIRIMELEPK